MLRQRAVVQPPPGKHCHEKANTLRVPHKFGEHDFGSFLHFLLRKGISGHQILPLTLVTQIRTSYRMSGFNDSLYIIRKQKRRLLVCISVAECTVHDTVSANVTSKRFRFLLGQSIGEKTILPYSLR